MTNLLLITLFAFYVSCVSIKESKLLIRVGYFCVTLLIGSIFYILNYNFNLFVLFNLFLLSLYVQTIHQFNNRYFVLYLLMQVLLFSLSLTTSSILLLSIQLLLFILAIDSKFLDERLLEEKTTSYQNKVLDKQIKEVQNIYTQMRAWRHDFHNHLQSLKVKLKFNQIEEASTYLNELENELKDIKQIVETGNLNFDAIMNSKLSLILTDENIDLNYKVAIPENVTITDTDLCALIGNLIDNAYESCGKIETGKFIRIYVGNLKEQFYISITNSTNEVSRKLDHEYITNKRGNHGHGLLRINNIVNKYDGFINRKNEPGVFVTEILLPLK